MILDSSVPSDERSNGSDSDSSTFTASPTTKQPDRCATVSQGSPAATMKATEDQRQLSIMPANGENRRAKLSRNNSKLGTLDEHSRSRSTCYQVASDIDVSSHNEQLGNSSSSRGTTSSTRVRTNKFRNSTVSSELDTMSRSCHTISSSSPVSDTKNTSNRRNKNLARTTSSPLENMVQEGQSTVNGGGRTPPTRSRSSEDPLGTSSEHVPRGAGKKNALPSQSRRGKLRRHHSMMIKALNDSMDISCHGLDLDQYAAGADQDVGESKGPKLRSILKKEGCPPSNKSARFATVPGEQKRKILCVFHYIDPVDESLKARLWWSDEDLDRRYDQDMDMAILVEARFERVMRKAFETAKYRSGKLHDVVFDYAAMSSCSLARGMEIEVFPEMREMKKRHRQAVLAAQDLIRDESGHVTFNDAEQKLVRLQSIKYSKAFQLVAIKLAQFDQLEAEATMTGDGNGDDSDYDGFAF